MSKMLVKLPLDLGRRARAMADCDGVSVQKLVETAVAEKVAGAQAIRILGNGRSKVTRERFLELLAKAPDVPPMPGDEIPPELAAKLQRLKARRPASSK
jgi:hypothetical protein